MTTMKQLGTMTCVILATALAATGCSSGASGNGTSSGPTPGTGGADAIATGGSAAPVVVSVIEVEPNDGPGIAGAQDLGSVAASETFVVKGELSSGGFDGTKYTGDFDLFTFDLAAAGSLDVSVSWTSGADVDVAIYDAELTQLAGDGTQAKPAAAKVASASGKVLVAVFSKDQATPYTLSIGYAKAVAGTGSAGTGSAGMCSPTPILAAAPAGGCSMDTTTPACSVADLRNGASFELAWTTHQTFCEGPHKVTIVGDPPSEANSVTYSISSSYSGSDASMTRNSGGYMLITAKDIATVTSTSGTYYYGVSSFYKVHTEGRPFQVIK